MAKDKHPYIQFYTGDYLKDTRSLSLAAKGAWSDLIVFMHTADERGVLVGTMADFARQIGGTLEETAAVLLELCLKKVCDRKELEGGFFQIICRRMVREAQISNVKAVSGSKGGSKTQAKRVAKTKQNPDNDNDNDIGSEDENIVEIGKKSETSISIKAKYAGERPRRIYDLSEYFKRQGQLGELTLVGWDAKFTSFMRDNPGRVFDDDNHLYNAIKQFKQNGHDRGTNKAKSTGVGSGFSGTGYNTPL